MITTSKPFKTSKLDGTKYLEVSWLFLLSLVVLALVYQLPSTYTVNMGQATSDQAIVKGFGGAEHNTNFSFRWTTDSLAELVLPDLGWPNQVELVGVAPRPDGSTPTVKITSGKTTTLPFNAQSASFPPAADGRLTFKLPGWSPGFSLTPQHLIIESDTYQPAGDQRSLGIVVTQISLKPVPNSWGFILPPLAAWLGKTLLVVLVFFSPKGKSRQGWLNRRPYLPALAILAVMVILRLLLPEWDTVSGVNLAWGLALPLTVAGFVPRCWREFAFLGLLVLAVLLVFYGLVLATFTVSLLLMVGLLLLLRERRTTGDLVLLSSLTAPLGWFYWQGRLPRATDLTEFHLFWINELDALIRQGNLYPRWAPDFTWQQGWPVFNYYPPLSRYLPELFHLAGLNFNNALLLSAYLGLVAGVTGCYFWVREALGNRNAAILGALVYGYLPYRLMDFFEGGQLSNYMGSAVLPWLVWLLTLLIRQKDNSHYAIWLGIAGALLVITSTPQLIVFLPVAGVYTLGLILWEWRKSGIKPWRVLARLMLAAGICLGLSAFFLLPAYFEINQVGLKFANSGLEDSSHFWTVFLGTLNLWQPVTGFYNAVLQGFGGIYLPVLALLGLVVLLLRQKDGRVLIAFIALAAGTGLFLQLPISRFFWQTFYSLTSIQFTSRFMYTVAVFLAPLVGGFILLVQNARFKWLQFGLAVMVTGILFYGCFQDFELAFWPPSFDGTISRKALTEQIGNGDVMYLPKGADNVAAVAKPFELHLASDRSLDATESLRWEITGPDSYQLEANLNKAGTLDIPLFWFKDIWKIEDQTGKQMAFSPAPGTSHIQLDLPVGNHTLVIKLQDSPIRFISNILSLLTLAGLVFYLLLTVFSHRTYSVAQPVHL